MGLTFTTDWLALREPFDHAARAPQVTAAAIAHLRDKPSPLIVDLGCGRGSNLRFLNARVPGRTSWRLVDHDPELLAEAARSIDSSAVETRLLDLRNPDIADVLAGADLVTAAALIDLVSGAWLERLVDEAAAAGTALLITGSVDGRVAWLPRQAEDAVVLGAYAEHQAGDKGFGGALGTRAPGALETLLQKRRWLMAKAESDWHEIADVQLQSAYLEGVGEALRDTRLSPNRLDGWLDRRRAAIRIGTSRLTVGHIDLFAAPPV